MSRTPRAPGTDALERGHAVFVLRVVQRPRSVVSGRTLDELLGWESV